MADPSQPVQDVPVAATGDDVEENYFGEIKVTHGNATEEELAALSAVMLTLRHEIAAFNRKVEVPTAWKVASVKENTRESPVVSAADPRLHGQTKR